MHVVIKFLVLQNPPSSLLALRGRYKRYEEAFFRLFAGVCPLYKL